MAKYDYWIEPEGLTTIEGWARAGLTDAQIAKNIGICRDTLIEWKKRFPDISDTLKKGKQVVDFQVESALLKRALGYEDVETVINSDAEGNEVSRRTTIKNVPPDTTAQIMWLKNRDPEHWRSKDREPNNNGTIEKLDIYLAEIKQQAVDSVEKN